MDLPINNTETCKCWHDIEQAFSRFRFEPKIGYDEYDGEYRVEEWIFRGHKSDCHPLQPSIERFSSRREWAELEYATLGEFQSRARLYMEPSQLPTRPNEGVLHWLALMQHYGAPTRLLDFTRSPYVALYFAIHDRTEEEKSHNAEIWCIDAAKIRYRSREIIQEVDDKLERKNDPGYGDAIISEPYEPESFFQSRRTEEDQRADVASKALKLDKRCSQYYKESGLIAVSGPTEKNARLASQQGIFLFNGAESLTFKNSLDLMMRKYSNDWYRRIQVPTDIVDTIEKNLFRMNIHALTLFPDAEGLARFLRDQIRLFEISPETS